jgi:hypothetical protein
MILCKELNREFGTKKELFEELKSNKDEIIKLKKAQIIKSCEKGSAVPVKVLKFKNEANKQVPLEDDSYYIAVNTTNFLD